MTNQAFQTQVQKLKETWGEKSYPPMRVQVFWHAVKSATDGEFERAITRLVANMRAAPMLKEILDALEVVKAEDGQRRVEGASYGNATFMSILEFEAKYTKGDKGFVDMCMQNLRDFQSKKISKTKFLANCDELDSMSEKIMIQKYGTDKKRWP